MISVEYRRVLRFITSKSLIEVFFWGWRDISVVKNTCWSCRENVHLGPSTYVRQFITACHSSRGEMLSPQRPRFTCMHILHTGEHTYL